MPSVVAWERVSGADDMTEIKNIFFDVGGVLGADGWDYVSRKRAVEHFKLDFEKFETAHAKYAAALDTAGVSMDQYLQEVVFKEARAFTPDEFFQFMKDESKGLSAIARDCFPTRCFWSVFYGDDQQRVFGIELLSPR